MKGLKVKHWVSYLLLLGLFFLIFSWFLLLRPVSQAGSSDPVATFNHGSIGNEDTQGIPYWIWRVLPVVFNDQLPGNREGYGALGFYWQPGAELPVGFSKKTLGVIPRVSFNCALCHQGSYRLQGESKSTLVPGGAGNRIMPQEYQRFILNVGQDPRFNADTIMAAIEAIYDMPLWERLTYRYILIPFTHKALKEQAVIFSWMDSKPEWGVGRIDPFNPVKFNHLQLPVDETIGNSDIMPLWDMDSVIKRKDASYALHWDGLNTDLHEVVVAGAIGDGMSYKNYRYNPELMKNIEDWIRLQKPPESPFSWYLPYSDPYYVDETQVSQGTKIYQDRCANCHEPQGKLFRTIIPASYIHTDRHRIDMWTDAAVERYTHYQQDEADWDFSHWQKVNGYVATELTGLWLKGPYLHNGSVPTLRDLLKPVSLRPQAFCRGSDVVDARNGGFQAPLEKESCTGFYFDTRVAGNSNSGHTYGTDLPPPDKEALLAYLKTL